MGPTKPPRVGISQCLLGDNVRYDGGHKLDSVLIETLGRHVEWVPVCPEVEVGLGTLEALNLSGFVFKSASPSCGIRQVPFFNTQGIETQEGVGLFARAFMAHFPEMPVEEESGLHNPQVLKDFLERVFDYRRSR
ncbi:MAG: hypothetical protein AUH96_07925 [Nitrospirae bacterium 13_2_20CM_2_61_4]|nr:MAG: hypothetical protein AUH96_07925 [Nitrospirae bacterium 13_2_20CM_2_61_4]